MSDPRYTEIRKRAEEYAKRYPWRLAEGAKDFLPRDRAFLLSRVEELEGQRAKALEAHQPRTQWEFPDGKHRDHWTHEVCRECGHGYPCATVAALNERTEP